MFIYLISTNSFLVSEFLKESLLNEHNIFFNLSEDVIKVSHP